MQSRIYHHVFTTAVLAALGTTTARAAPVQPDLIIKAWVWANQPTAAMYTPSVSYQYNLRTQLLPSSPFRAYASANNTIARTAAGVYRVVFTGLAAAGGTVHVTAYGGNHHCKVSGWGPSGADMQVNVLCFSSAGTLVDGMFTALLYKDGNKSTIYGNAYLWADQPSSPACYTPSPGYQFNSRGDTNTICRAPGVPVGEWDVTLRHMERHSLEADKGGDVQVTAYGSGPERCKVRHWFPSGNDIVARVACTLNGTPADTRFTLSFMRMPGELAIVTAEDTQEAFYVWANGVPPDNFYQCDSYGGDGATLEAPSTGLPTGNYRVHLPGVKSSGSTAMVTAYGDGNAYCNVVGWGADAAINGTVVNVRCWDAGQPVNTLFTLFYNTDQLTLF